MHFKQYFYETLRVDDAVARSQLRNHPLVRQGTFGVEIEFIVTGMPSSQWGTNYLVDALEDTSFEQELYQKYGYIEDHQDGRTETVQISDREWRKFFKKYIADNREEALEAFQDRMEDFWERDDQHGINIMTSYWKNVVEEMIQKAGFKTRPDEAQGETWGVGDDGTDSEEGKPVVEIRTGIMTEQDMPRFERVLIGFQQLFSRNKSYLRVAGNTGLHVHISNPAINLPGGPDPFTRLASIASLDEEKIWDDLAPHDRSFERFSALNRQQDFSNYSDKGFHQMIIEWVWFRLNPDRSKVSASPRGAANFSVNVTSKQLSDFMGGFDRNVGVNTRSRQPTVEYRQLSSVMLTDPQGPQKVIDYIRYFLENTAGLSNKNQFVIKNEDTRVVFTRLQGGAKIDFQKRESSDSRFSRVRQTGDTADSMRKLSTPPPQPGGLPRQQGVNLPRPN